MRRSTLLLALALTTVLIVWAQQSRIPDHPPFEVKSLFPREFSPGQYEHVGQREIEALAAEGWELVSVTPYIYRNEERGEDTGKIKPVVTQTYQAYFFKRRKIVAR